MAHPYNHTSTFMRIENNPILEQKIDIGLVGFCLDLGTSNRAGTRSGPSAIRTASTQLTDGHHPYWEIDPSTELYCYDYGDVFLPTGNYNRALLRIEAEMNAIADQVKIPISMGGDHSITLPILRALKTKYKEEDIALIHFDAHRDYWEPSHDSPITHGTMFRQAIKEELIKGENFVQIGIRSPCPKEVMAWGKEQGIIVLGAQMVHFANLDTIVKRIKTVARGKKTYLSFDIDCLDPSQAPGTGTPEVGGLRIEQILYMLYNLTDIEFIGFDLVEVCPAYDVAEITSLAAATLIWNFMCLAQLQLGR